MMRITFVHLGVMETQPAAVGSVARPRRTPASAQHPSGISSATGSPGPGGVSCRDRPWRWARAPYRKAAPYSTSAPAEHTQPLPSTSQP